MLDSVLCSFQRMLYWLFYSFVEEIPLFNVFRYLTFRSGLAALTAFLFVILFGRTFIRKARARQFGQAIREDGPVEHLKKKGTPTFGGLLIVGGFSTGVLLWCDLSNIYIWLLLALSWTFAMIGLLDDYLKVVRRDPKGLPSRWKFRLQYLCSVVFSIVLYKVAQDGWDFGRGVVFLPLLKSWAIDMGPWYMLFSVIVLVASSNAVNLTDGLDGLAIGPIITCTAAFFILCYLGGNAVFARYLSIPFVPGLGEVSVFCAAICAACMAFLWYNSYPAEIFMGDIGSLSLGAAFGALGLITKNEFLLVILGGVFVMVTLSVIMQVTSFKLTGKRVFRMAPIHHHFELKGVPEPKIIVRFWIVSIVLAILALSTLKLR